MTRSIVPCCAALLVACGGSNPVAPPVLSDVALSTDEDTPLVLEVPSTPVGVDLTIATPPAHGTVTGGPIWTYHPTADYSGPDVLVVRAENAGGSATATVTITVLPVDDPPAAVDDDATVTQGAGATPLAVLDNDTDVDAGPSSITSVSQPANGIVAITGNGTGLTYAPDTAFCNGAPEPALRAPMNAASLVAALETFTYTLSPGGSTATVSVTVTCVDDAPVAVDDTATVTEGGTADVGVLANDTDGDGGPKAVASVTQPAHGTAAVAPGGLSVTYTSNAGYCNGAPNAPRDTFTYTLTPGGSSATVSIAVPCACGLRKATDFVVGSN